MFEQKTTSSILTPVANVHRAAMFWYTECVEVYEGAKGNVPGFPKISGLIASMEFSHKALTEVINTFEPEIQKEMEDFVSFAVDIRDAVRRSPGLVLPEPNIVNNSHGMANKCEEVATDSLYNILGKQLTQMEGLIARARALL